MLTKLNKRGQLKILESVAVLIVFFFLVGMGVGFYGKIQLQSLEAAKAEFKSLDATKISQKIIHMPEMRCSLQNTDKGSCIDLYQAKSWAALLNDGDCSSQLGSSALCGERLSQYFEEIGVAEVVLTTVYSANSATIIGPASDVILYNYTSNEVTGSKFTQIPVAIYNPFTHSSDLGILKVRVYE